MTPKITDEQRQALNAQRGQPVVAKDEQTHSVYYIYTDPITGKEMTDEETPGIPTGRSVTFNPGGNDQDETTDSVKLVPPGARFQVAMRIGNRNVEGRF